MIRRILLALFILSGIAHADWGNRLTDAYDVKQETKSDSQLLQWVSADNLWELKDLDDLGLDTYYLRTNCSNDPLTAALDVWGQLSSYDATHAKYAALYHDGTDGVVGTNSGALSLIPATNINAILGDAAGTYEFAVKDSGVNTVASIDSDGNGYFAGNVGIGTSAPGVALQIGSVTETGNPKFSIYGARPGVYIPHIDLYIDTSGFARFDSSNREFVFNQGCLFSSNVAVGTNSASSRLIVVGGSDIVQTIIKANATQTNDILQLQNSSSTPLVVVQGDGDVGIGSTVPSAKLDVSASAGTLQTTASASATNSLRNALIIKHRTDGNMADGFGPTLSFVIRDNAQVDNTIAEIGAVRAGADNTGDILFRAYAAGSGAEKMRIMSSGNVGIGTSSPSAKLDVAGTVKLGSASTDTITCTGRLIVRTAASNPQDATPGNRPAGSVAEIVYYSGKLYFCTNAATPTWELITSS